MRPTLARPDLTIGLARTNACTWSTDVDGEVWVNPLIVAHGTGIGLPSLVSFNMVSNYAKHTAGGGLHVNAAQTWAIDIGPSASLSALGHVLKLTLNVDPTHEVAESNESNNSAVITIDLTGISTPPGAGDAPLACH